MLLLYAEFVMLEFRVTVLRVVVYEENVWKLERYQRVCTKWSVVEPK